MIQRKMFVKRREYERFIVLTNAFAELSANSDKIGEIKNISLNGLTICHRRTDKDTKSLWRRIRRAVKAISLKKYYKISIIMKDEDWQLEGIPCKTVTKFEVNRGSSESESAEYLCLQFGKLRHDQIFHLKNFIKNHTGDSLNDRRNGRERRRYNSPQYHKILKRGVDRREWWQDRRACV